jgi:microcystin-dependent protein
LLIPDSLDWLKLVNGALGTLGVTDFFVETDGGVSIDDTVAEFLEMVIASMDGCPGGGSVIGEIKTLATSSLPVGMLWCDGTQYLRTAYPDLYAALDSSFIVDADNFVVPDLREVFVIGAGVVHSVGDTGGEATHTLTIDEIPDHAHVVYRASNIGTASTRVAGGASNTIGATTTTSVGGGLAHNNMPPFNTLNKAIVAEV